MPESFLEDGERWGGGGWGILALEERWYDQRRS